MGYRGQAGGGEGGRGRCQGIDEKGRCDGPTPTADVQHEQFEVDVSVAQMSEHSTLAADIAFYDADNRAYLVEAVIDARGVRFDADPLLMRKLRGPGAGAHQVWGRLKDGRLSFKFKYTQFAARETPIPRGEPLFGRAQVRLRYWPDMVRSANNVLPSEYGRVDVVSRPLTINNR